MAGEPSSYGTGRDPQRKGSYLIPVFLLLLSCVVVHGLTHLYLSNRNRQPKKDTGKLSIQDLPTEDPDGSSPLRDNCGLGLELSDVSDIQQRYWSLPDGVFIEQIETGSTAYAAGLRSGDLLLQIEDHQVSDPEACLEILEEYCEDETLELIYYRDGEEYSLSIPLE